MKKVISEFKEFISRGNVMDMAVGIIIGGAFTNVVSSLVKDIINPILGLFGGMNFDRLSWNIIGDVALNYGSFLTVVFPETKKKKNKSQQLKSAHFVKVKLISRRADAHTAHQIWRLWTDLLGKMTVCSFVIG